MSPSKSDESVSTIDRDLTADARDVIAEALDAAATDRDQRSEARDRRANQREETGAGHDENATSDRSAAQQDRRSAAGDRRNAADDRQAAAADRRISAAEGSMLLLDELTGTYLRGPGLNGLGREVIKAHRTGMSFILAFADVDDLKATNESGGHDAGDRLLRHVAQTIRGNLREYDLVVRYGGDEFVCGLTDMSLEAAKTRFERINLELAISSDASASMGVVQLQAGETLEALLRRADTAMYAAKAANN